MTKSPIKVIESVLSIKPGIQMGEMESKVDYLVIHLQMWK